MQVGGVHQTSLGPLRSLGRSCFLKGSSRCFAFRLALPLLLGARKHRELVPRPRPERRARLLLGKGKQSASVGSRTANSRLLNFEPLAYDPPQRISSRTWPGVYFHRPPQASCGGGHSYAALPARTDRLLRRISAWPPALFLESLGTLRLGIQNATLRLKERRTRHKAEGRPQHRAAPLSPSSW